MDYDIKTKGLGLTDAIRRQIGLKMESLAPKVARFGEAVRAEVEVAKTTQHHKKGDVFRAEISVNLPNKLIYAAHEGEDLYQCLNEAKQEAERQIIDYKERFKDAQRRR